MVVFLIPLIPLIAIIIGILILSLFLISVIAPFFPIILSIGIGILVLIVGLYLRNQGAGTIYSTKTTHIGAPDIAVMVGLLIVVGSLLGFSITTAFSSLSGQAGSIASGQVALPTTQTDNSIYTLILIVGIIFGAITLNLKKKGKK